MAVEKEASTSEHEFVQPDAGEAQAEFAFSINNTPEILAFQERPLDLRTILGLLALAVTYEACLFSFALPAAILLTINNSVGPSGDIAWAATSWALASAVIMTIAGRCSDIFGRRNYFLAGNIMGVLGCGIACSASSVSVIIVGSSFLGLAAGLQQLAFAAANEIVPKKNRGHILALMSLISLPGSSFGAPIAYKLVSEHSWRWIYYVALCVNALALLLIAICYWPPNFLGLHPEGMTRRQQFVQLDFVGLLLFGGGLTAFLMGIGFGGNPHPWTSRTVLVPTILGGVSVFVAFPAWEKFSSESITKLCPPRLMTNLRGVVVPFAVSFAGGMALISTGILWPQQVQRLFTTVPQSVGWYGMATNGGATAGLMIAGYTFSTFRRTRFQYMFVVIMMTTLLGLNAIANQNTPALATVLVTLASSMIGATNCMGILIAQLGARDEDIGIVTGLLNSLRSTGGAVGVAIYSSLIANKVNSSMAKLITSAVVQAGLPESSVGSFLVALPQGAFGGVHGATPAIVAAGLNAQREVYSNAFRLVYLVTLAFGGLAIMCALFVADVDKYLNGQVNVQLDRPRLLGKISGVASVKDEPAS